MKTKRVSMKKKAPAFGKSIAGMRPEGHSPYEKAQKFGGKLMNAHRKGGMKRPAY